jgi:8-oxo-dGTP diphosphatase
MKINDPKTIKIETLKEMMKPRHKYRITAVDAVIIKDGQVLLQKRSMGLFRGYWVLPGGKVEAGEDTWGAVAREALEETGLRISVIRMIGFYDDPERDPEKHAVSMAFLCRPTGGKLQMSKEALEIKWFPVDKLPEKMGFDNGKIISDVRKSI